MKLFIVLLGILWIALGIVTLVAPKKTVSALEKWVKKSKRKSLGLIGLVFGVLLLISASAVRESWFIFALGIIACLKGAVTTLISEKTFKALIEWKLAAPEIVYKCWASFMLVLGVAIFYII